MSTMSKLEDESAFVAKKHGFSFSGGWDTTKRDIAFVKFSDGPIFYPVEVTALELFQNDGLHLRDLIETRLTQKLAEWKRFAKNAAGLQ